MQAFLDWIGAHPLLALTALCLACAIEGLFVIGIVIPGALILFAAGALVALGSLDGSATVAVAAAGAVLGDAVTFWIGRRYGRALFATPWMQRRPELLARGQAFFAAHGRKSILLGRLIGPLRPLMPAIAGAWAMPWATFLLVDAAAALLWATIYLLPGVVFGASLNLAAEVATHMVVLVCVVVALVWGVAWLSMKAVSLAGRHGERWVHALLDWSHRHRRMGRLGEYLADPDQPETLGLLVIAVILLATGHLILYLAWGIGSPAPMPQDAFAWQILRNAYTPALGYVAGAFATLGTPAVYVPVALAVLVTLVALRRTQAAAHWLAAIGFATLIALGLYVLLPLPDPLDYFAGRRAHGFPGRDLILSTAIYGFIPVLATTRARDAVRRIVWTTTVTLLALILGSQIYLGMQWASVAALSTALGAVWVACLALGYRRHRARRIPLRPFLAAVIGTLLVAAALAWRTTLPLLHERARPQLATVQTTIAQWWNGQWAVLPARRIGVGGRPEQPLAVQWAGELDEIDALLATAGWRAPVPLNWRTALHWLAPTLPFDQLPVLPQVHAGRYPALVRVRPEGAGRMRIIRLWDSGWRVDSLPLWLGSVGMLVPDTSLPMFRFPSSHPQSPDALLADGLPLASRRVVADSVERLLLRPDHP